MVGVHEPLAAIQDAVNLHGFDELIISTLPTRVSRWLKLDLPHKAAGLGLPVTTVTAQGTERIPAHALTGDSEVQLHDRDHRARDHADHDHHLHPEPDPAHGREG